MATLKFGLKREDKLVSSEQTKEQKEYISLNIPKYDEDEDVFPKVVHVNSKEPYDIYIGRNEGYGNTEFGNPFVIGKDGTRDEVIDKFETHLLKNPELLEKAKRLLKGKRLGCHCSPLRCHGDVYLKYVNPEMFPDSVKKNKP